jgi:transcriptional regulator
MGEAPPDYIDTMLRNIVGIEVAITALVGKSKLSQNKEPRDRRTAADTLAERGQPALAEAMRTALPALKEEGAP